MALKEVVLGTFTGVAAGSPIEATLGVSDNLRPAANHTVQSVIVGTSTSTGQLEGSLDGVTWDDLSGAQAIDGEGSDMFHVAERPVKFIRFNMTAYVGADSITVFYLGHD